MNKLMFFSSVFALLGMLSASAQADVTVRYSRGTLTLKGNTQPDTVEIFGIGPNEVVVSVNGDEEEFAYVQNIRITMGKGADFVGLYDVDLSGNLDVDLGGDLDDESEITNSIVRGAMTMKGASDTRVFDTNVGKTMTVKTGLPFDIDGDGMTLSLDNLYVGGKSTVNGGSKSLDSMNVTGSFFGTDLIVNLGAGNDGLLLSDNFIARDLNLDGAAGTDMLQASSNTVGRKITLRKFEISL